IAVSIGLLQMAMVVSDARLQEAIRGPARATATSVAGVGAEAVALVFFLGFAGTAGVLAG
ncbi:MAG TPA: hypothetical protein VES42_19850, partial [Pilimelia sp.]|nr:hypothetical protein [Pilimelia sp.]